MPSKGTPSHPCWSSSVGNIRSRSLFYVQIADHRRPASEGNCVLRDSQAREWVPGVPLRGSRRSFTVRLRTYRGAWFSTKSCWGMFGGLQEQSEQGCGTVVTLIFTVLPIFVFWFRFVFFSLVVWQYNYKKIKLFYLLLFIRLLFWLNVKLIFLNFQCSLRVWVMFQWLSGEGFGSMSQIVKPQQII